MNRIPRVGLVVLSALACLFPARGLAQDPSNAQYSATVLLRNLKDPTSVAFLPDGRIYLTLKNGVVKLVNPVTKDTSTAGTLPSANLREDGLYALALDPGWAVNKWVYALTSERTATDTSLVVLRYLTDSASGAILAGSRATLLRIPYTLNTGPSEHNTGTLAFGPDGNLYIGLADNTQNIFNGTGAGYAPRDTALPLYDAQRSAANTNDLRGKILRVRPEANGTYSIPAGNLKDSIHLPAFNPNWNAGEDPLSKVRPEIFLMGLRHPFRITVDQATGWLYWAEPGPNASADNASQGPRGYEIVGMAKGPGNYGWPYCRGNPATIPKPGAVTTPFCYTQYNYSGSGTAGPMYNPNALRNTSRNNTGIVNLPPLRAAQVWYPYATSSGTGANFPVFRANTGGGNAGMLGPVYHYDGAANAPPGRLPIAFDNHLFVIEWHRNLLFAARLNASGAVDSVRPFRDVNGARDTVVNGPIDVKIGPDGALYFVNWGSNTYSTNSGNGSLVRLAYTGTQVGVDMMTRRRRAEAIRRDFLFAAGTGGVFPLPDGATGADVYSLRGERLWSYRRGESSAAQAPVLPAGVRGVVRVRLQYP